MPPQGGGMEIYMAEKNKLYPVMIGADLNCYNLARAFHMAYKVKSYAFGRYAVSATKYSSIVKFTVVENIDKDEVLISVLTEFASSHNDGKLILFGCTDDYAAMLIRNKHKLPMYIIPYPSAELLSQLSRKAEFYKVCDKYDIPYPKTFIIEKPMPASELTNDKLGFSYPIIIKPSSSADYWKHEFKGMKKVYVSKSAEDSENIISEIYDSGYPDKIIAQEFIEGSDSNMRVLTAFSDENGKVRAMCLGHTMVEEHTPKGLGNHAAIVTEPVSDLPVALKIKEMLEDLGYTGFSNFDIKCRGSSDDFRVFEINLRQGRSNMYVTASGINIARLAAEKYQDDGEDCELCDNFHFWHHIPKSTAYKYTEDPELVKTAENLAAQGKETSSIWYPKDFIKNPLRLFCVLEQLRRQKKKFMKYYPKNDKC